MLGSRLDDAVDLMKYNNAAMLTGIEVKPSDSFSIESITGEVSNLPWVTYWVIGGGFVILYVGLVGIALPISKAEPPDVTIAPAPPLLPPVVRERSNGLLV